MSGTLPEPYSGEPLATDRVVVKDPEASLTSYPERMTAGGEDLATDEIRVNIIHKGVGAITESDVLLASTAGGIIVGFNVRPAGKARKMAEEQGVDHAQLTVLVGIFRTRERCQLTPGVRREVGKEHRFVVTMDVPGSPRRATVSGPSEKKRPILAP